MTVQTSYPGIYIQELPSLVHTIQPAPTSIAVFVGYTHPFLTKTFKTPVQLFSFSDYQTNFGGFFSSPWQPDYVGQAVFQFFLNGGSTCYAVGLEPKTFFQGTAKTAPDPRKNGVPAASALFPPNAAAGDAITFTAEQPVGVAALASSNGSATANVPGIPMSLQFSNYQDPGATVDASGAQGSTTGTQGSTTGTQGSTTGTQGSTTGTQGSADSATVDIVITYGTTVETYRKVSLANLQATLQNSSLVKVSVPSGLTKLPKPSPVQQQQITLDYTNIPTDDTAPLAGFTVIDPSGNDFIQVFQDNQPLDKVPIFNLLVMPGITSDNTSNNVLSEAIAYCERKRALCIMDTPPPSIPLPFATTPPVTPTLSAPNQPWDVDHLVQLPSQNSLFLSENIPVSTNAAVHYPWLITSDPITGAASVAPPSGFVTGMFSQEDNTRGAWKSPAGIETTLLGTTGVDPNGVMTDLQQGVLNQNAVNCLREFPGIGTVIFGARTTAGAAANTAQQQWRYVAVRRMALFIEQTLYANLTWAVFEGNSTPLWNALTQEVTAFMLSLFRLGAFAGDTPSQAFVVKCDSTTTTADDIANGIVNILVGFAPLVPAEFVVVKIAQLAGQAQS